MKFRKTVQISFVMKEEGSSHHIKLAYSLLNLLKPTGHVMHHQFNIQQL